MTGVKQVLYRLDELRTHETIAIVEGEKDVDRCWSLGIAATCNAGGAGKWRAAYVEQLRSVGVTSVAVIPDNDAAGRRHAMLVAQGCAAAGLRVKIVTLPAPAKDVSEFFDAGGTRDALNVLVAGASHFRPNADAFPSGKVIDLKGGVRVLADVLQHVLDLEGRGVAFSITDGQLIVSPSELLTDADMICLRRHKDDVGRIVRYEAPPV
jgi:DNA primase